MTPRRTVSALLLAALVAGAPAARALSTDRDQPIEIEADFAELDDSRGVTMYKGNVIVTQGSLKLTGESLCEAGSWGVDPQPLRRVVEEVAAARALGGGAEHRRERVRRQRRQRQ